MLSFDLNIKSILIYLLIALGLYILAKLILKLVDYLLFKKLSSYIIDKAFEDEAIDENPEGYNKKSFQTEDEWMKDKNKRKEQLKMEEEKYWAQIRKNKKIKTKIVGVAKNAILGKWTALVVKRMANKLRFIDPRDVEEKGFYQAIILAEKRSKGIQKESQNSRNI